MSARSSLQKYTVRVKKPENRLFKFCDPHRVFQRARACRNIRFGSSLGVPLPPTFLTQAGGHAVFPATGRRRSKHTNLLRGCCQPKNRTETQILTTLQLPKTPAVNPQKMS